MASINGDSGDNTLIGTADADQIHGLAGNDVLSGLDGNDMLFGDEGDDILEGGAGRDALYGDLWGAPGVNILRGGDDGDFIYVYGSDEAFGDGGDDWVQVFGHATVLQGGEGIDILGMRGGILDSFGAANGFEQYFGNNSVHGTEADNILDFSGIRPWDADPLSTGGFTVWGEAGNDTLIGTAVNDTLYGGSGSNTLVGGDGADVIYSIGADSVDGGAGDDVIHLAGGLADANRTVVGGTGVDRLVITNVTLETFAAGSGLELIDRSGVDGIVNGTDGHNILNFLDLSPLVVGGPGLVVDGGLGGDAITGTQGFDTLYGGVGGDFLDGQHGNDKVYGGAGNDIVHGNGGADVVSGEAGHDTVYGGEGNDTATGGAGDDELWGDAGADALKGEDGNDILVGGSGDDILTGGADNDILTGGQGRDILSGGNGTDLFVFADGDLTDESTTTDRINDFKSAQGDSLDLSAIDADTTLGGDQAFVVVGAFSGVAGQATLTTASGATTLAMDVNGDGAADYLLLMAGTVSSTAGWVL